MPVLLHVGNMRRVNRASAGMPTSGNINLTKEQHDKIPDINIKRSFFASFVNSPLFVSYLNSGLTAMRHPELEPRDVVLNTLHSVNDNYLNNRTFEMASIITNHLRHLSGI